MSKTRVLVVDDSAAIRRMLTEILSADPQIEVIGAAPNAATALTKLRQSAPDVVTLDVEMPDVTGLEILAQIRRIAPKLPVIMFSALTQHAAATTLEALALGATDYVTKPAGTGSREASIEQVRAQLIPKIKALGGRSGSATTTTIASSIPSAARPTRVATTRSTRVDLVAIGTSTGGPSALGSLFQGLPAGLPVPIVIVQHMPPMFTKLLSERLSATFKRPFHEAREGDELVPGEIWIAPGDYHMRVVRNGPKLKVALDQGPPENSCRPAVDVLFRSVVDATGANSLAVVLTGMGQDGLRGCELLHAAGAQIIVQDEPSSVVWGMPGAVARAGIAEKILPLDSLASEMLRRVSARAPSQVLPSPELRHAR